MMPRVCLVALLSILTVSTAWAAPNETKISELAPGVYFRKAQTEPKFTGCNQGWVVFKDFVLVIDANFPGQAEEVIKVIRQYTDKPIRFAFDTHYHGDHADGNQQYTKIGATVVAHERSQPLFETKGLEGFTTAQKDKDRQAEYGPLHYAMPSLYFSHKLIFDDGTQRVELIFLGHAPSGNLQLQRQEAGESERRPPLIPIPVFDELDPMVIAPDVPDFLRGQSVKLSDLRRALEVLQGDLPRP